MSEPARSVTAEEVWAEVNAIIASPAFAHSPRLGRLIVYLCTKSLRGEAGQRTVPRADIVSELRGFLANTEFVEGPDTTP